MRLNKYLAAATDLSRRGADEAITAGQVSVNGQPAQQGQDIGVNDVVALQGRRVQPPVMHTTIMLNKPVGLVVSRQGQGSRTIYDVLPPKYQRLNPVGRLDKDSSGLLLLTDDGNLAQELTHPSRQKVKIYEVTLDKPLQPLHQQMISDHGVMLSDGISKFAIQKVDAQMSRYEARAELQGEGQDDEFTSSSQRRGEPLLITMHEGRNRQIRRTFQALGYHVKTLHRTHFGPYRLGTLPPGSIEIVSR